MDKIDTRILSILQRDGQISMARLSEQVGLSLSACHRRVKLLETDGTISHYAARLNRKQVGLEIQVFIEAKLISQRREDIEAFGAFVEVHVATSIEECEKRDRKGLYKLAREGKIKEFTGISDPYDVPENPELRLDTENVEVDHCAHQVLLQLEQMGLVAG